MRIHDLKAWWLANQIIHAMIPCGFNAECIFVHQCWRRSVPLNLLHKPLCPNLAQSAAAKFHEPYRQALNPSLCSWSSAVIQADAIKKCLFMRLLSSKTFHQANCASVTRLPPLLHVFAILSSPLLSEAILRRIIVSYRIFYLPELN